MKLVFYIITPDPVKDSPVSLVNDDRTGEGWLTSPSHPWWTVWKRLSYTTQKKLQLHWSILLSSGSLSLPCVVAKVYVYPT